MLLNDIPQQKFDIFVVEKKKKKRRKEFIKVLKR